MIPSFFRRFMVQLTEYCENAVVILLTGLTTLFELVRDAPSSWASTFHNTYQAGYSFSDECDVSVKNSTYSLNLYHGYVQLCRLFKYQSLDSCYSCFPLSFYFILYCRSDPLQDIGLFTMLLNILVCYLIYCCAT